MPKSNDRWVVEVETLTGDVIELDPGDICYVAFGENGYIKKLAKDLSDQDVVLNIEFKKKPEMPLERAVPILYESISRYRTARDFWYMNLNGETVTLTQYELFIGMEEILETEEQLHDITDILTNEHRVIDRGKVETRIKLEIRAAAEKYNDKHDLEPETPGFVGLSDEQMDNWLQGRTLTAMNWRLYQALSDHAGYGRLNFLKLGRKKPKWTGFKSWERGNGAAYDQWNILGSYHAQFTRVLGEHGIDVLEKNSNNKKPSVRSDPKRTGFADDVNELLIKMGVKRKEKIAVVVAGKPLMRQVSRKPRRTAGLVHRKQLVGDDVEQFNEEEIAPLINEFVDLQTSLLSASRIYLFERPETHRYSAMDKLERDITYATWKFMLKLLPGDTTVQVNLERAEALIIGYDASTEQADLFYDVLNQGYETGELDDSLVHAFGRRGLELTFDLLTSDGIDSRKVNSLHRFVEECPTVDDATERLLSLRPAIPKTFGDLLSNMYLYELSGKIRDGELPNLTDDLLEKYSLTGSQRSSLNSYIGDVVRAFEREYDVKLFMR